MIAPRNTTSSIRQEANNESAGLRVDNIADKIQFKQRSSSFFSTSVVPIDEDKFGSSSNSSNSNTLKVVVSTNNNNNNNNDNDIDATASTGATASVSSHNTSGDSASLPDSFTSSSFTNTSTSSSMPSSKELLPPSNDADADAAVDAATTSAARTTSTSLRAKTSKLFSSLRISGGGGGRNKSKSKNTKSAATTKEEAVTSQTFVDAAGPIIARIEEHPFLASMADGTLHEENFRDYILQDALYLHELAACLRLLGGQAPTHDATARLELFASNIENCVHEIHGLFLLKWKTAAAAAAAATTSDDYFVHDPTAAMPHTLMASSYLRRVVTSEKYALGLAVLLPCVWIHMGVVVQTLLRRSKKRTTNNNNSNAQQTQQQQQQQGDPLSDAWIDLYARRFKTLRGMAYLNSWCKFGMKMDVIDFAGMVDAECERLRENHTSDAVGCSKLQRKLTEMDRSTLKRMQQHFVMGCRFEHMLLDQARTRLRWPDDDDDMDDGL